MKRLTLIVAFIAGLAVFFGCAQRKTTQAPEQPVAQAPAASTEGTQKTVSPAASVTEKQLPKAQQAETQSSDRELAAKVRDINFDFDQYDIKDDAKPALKELAALLTKENSAKVIVEGYCDERGTDEYNLALGERRANAAKAYLTSLGIPSARIQTISYGEEKPLCSENTEECWVKNRRDHFVLTAPK
jgi:peptidoglycan-associated lipoprotein